MSKSTSTVSTCRICDSLRPITDHLYEIALFCMYLDNSITNLDAEGTREVRTVVIGNWLRLASQLESVEINAWRHATNDALWCSTAADRFNIDSKIFTKYATELTRFIYICFALEETYRFVSPNYTELVVQKNSKPTKRITTYSVQSAYLINKFESNELPNHTQHIIGNLIFYFNRYCEIYLPAMSGLDNVSKNEHSFGLHVIRNLRNHISHGIFPLMDEFIDPDDTPLISDLVNLLHHASRSATIYIQALIGRYCDAFKSYEYQVIEGAHGEEFDYFLKNCTKDYALSLHFKGLFSLYNWSNCKD